MNQAEEGVALLAQKVDTLIVVPNDRLLQVIEKRTSMLEAFRIADDILRQGTQGITDLITIPGLINLDFADVRAIMKDAGSAMMGIGIASGENRAADAAKEAISSKLLESSIVGADRILYSITGGSDMSLQRSTRRRRSSTPRPTRTRTSSSVPSSTSPWATRFASRSSPRVSMAPSSRRAWTSTPSEREPELCRIRRRRQPHARL